MMVMGDPATEGTAADVLIYNNDGTLAGACGNGTRCVVDRLCRELGASAVKITTEAGVIACERLGPWSYRVDMGVPRLDWNSIPLQHAVPDTRRVNCGQTAKARRSWARPRGQHGQSACGVLRVQPEPIDAAKARDPGSRSIAMFPEKANVTFAEIVDRDEVRARVWERGVGLDPRLRLGRLRDPGRCGAAWAYGSHGDSASPGRRPYY